ncbi:a49-like RNA polymerase i associated factor protein [Rutstroemia sp. NJR-2017a BBW]|nr:a49-like RNA polymerase i associated factor protein [Rutstroemia sp. NJR-2017a BBW]
MGENTDKNKKRKRDADGSSRSSKKVAIKEDRNIKISLQESDAWAPVIASTPGLAVPASIALKCYTKSRKNAPQRAGRSGAIATNEVLLYSSEHPKLDYTAREEGAGGSDALLKHYIGVYNPVTGQLDVMESRRMVVRGSVRVHQAATEEVAAKQSVRDLRNDLGETFGTKKAKKAIASVTENAISVNRGSRLLADGAKPAKLDAAQAAVVASMAEANAGMATREALEQQADAAKPRPKANVGATELKDVYTVDNLIGSEIFKSIPVLEWQKSVKEKKNISTNSKYVSSRIVNAATVGVEKLKILRYLLLLLDLDMACKPIKGGKQLPKADELRTKLGNVPEPVVADIRRKFSDAAVMSRFKNDLLITHICALACLIDNYEVDLYDLQLDLKLGMKEMSQYFKEIGARVTDLTVQRVKDLGLDKAAASQRRMAKLKLPLEFPKVPMAGKRR